MPRVSRIAAFLAVAAPSRTPATYTSPLSPKLTQRDPPAPKYQSESLQRMLRKARR